jgi:hypothetical protein
MSSDDRRRARGDRARKSLYFQSKAVQASGATFIGREILLREGGPFEDVLFHATPEDIARLDGETALRLLNWSPDEEGWRIWPEVIWEVLEPGPEPLSAAPAENERATRISKRGRPPSPWWPAFAAALAMQVYLHGMPEKQADLEETMLQWLTNHGHDVGRETIRPAIARLFEMFRDEQQAHRS